MSDLASSNTLVVPFVQVVPASDLPNFWSFKYLNSNAGLPLLACSIFFACSLIHLSMLVIYKRFYMLPLIVGLFLQVLGQVFKIICVISTSTSKTLNYYALFSLVTDFAPFLFLTTLVWMMRLMMKASNSGSFPLLVRVATHQIIMLALIAFLLQVYGLIVQLNPLLSNIWSAGNLVTLIGSAIELFNFLWVWLLLSVILWKQKSTLKARKHFSFKFWGFATVITVSVTLMMIRTTSRFVFHLINPAVEPFRNELLTFLLQSLPIALCAAFLIVFHPYRYDGGILEEDHSFFSPGTPMIATSENETRESRILSMNRSSNGSDPFWAVPLGYSIGRRSSPHNSYVHFNRFPSSSNSYNLHGSEIPHGEHSRDDREVSTSEDSAVSEVFRIDTKVYEKNLPELNGLSVTRQNPSINCKNLFNGQVFPDLQATSPQIQHDDCSMTSYYNDTKKTDPVWHANINESLAWHHNVDENSIGQLSINEPSIFH